MIGSGDGQSNCYVANLMEIFILIEMINGSSEIGFKCNTRLKVGSVYIKR